MIWLAMNAQEIPRKQHCVFTIYFFMHRPCLVFDKKRIFFSLVFFWKKKPGRSFLPKKFRPRNGTPSRSIIEPKVTITLCITHGSCFFLAIGFATGRMKSALFPQEKDTAN
jgi:hypothetical protein